MKILIVEDEPRLANALLHIMKEQKYLAEAVSDGQTALDYALGTRYDLMILDIMLPKLDGREVVKRMRAANNSTPVLMLTALDTVADKVAGLNNGADDYMAKPFSTEELLARVKALTRRQGDIIPDRLTTGDLTLDTSRGELSCGSESVKLSYKELEVMRILMTNPSLVTTKDHLICEVWGIESDAEDNNVEAYISFLRKKLKFIGSHITVKNRQKLGYVLEEIEC